MCMCLTPTLINFVKPSFMLNNNVIPYVENCKYLGIIIHLQSDLYDIKRQISKLYANTNMLLREFSICFVLIAITCIVPISGSTKYYKYAIITLCVDY